MRDLKIQKLKKNYKMAVNSKLKKYLFPIVFTILLYKSQISGQNLENQKSLFEVVHSKI